MRTARTKVRTGAPKKSQNRNPNWLDIKKEFEANKDSVRSIAQWHGISEAAIRKRAAKEGWTRRPAKDSQKVAERIGEIEVSPALEKAAEVEPEDLVKLGRSVIARLLAEVDAATSQMGVLEKLIIDATGADRSGARAEALARVTSIPTRASTLKNLLSAAKLLSDAEQAKGKKAAQKEVAEREATSGRFAVRPPPQLVVSNG